LYRKVYEELLAIPVVPGKKTEKEKFAGGDYTTTVEAYISVAGRAIQGATSHHLGQNFAKMFDISFEDPEKAGQKDAERCFAYQNSWGITTRTIGVMVMVHGDDKGLVLPPRIACTQAICVPCGFKSKDEQLAIENKLGQINQKLRSSDIRSDTDFRDNYKPGWKFAHWEQKGVPIRIEIGPKDLDNNSCVLVRRDTGDKINVSFDLSVDGKDPKSLESIIANLLEEIQANMYKKASNDLNSHMRYADNWDDFIQGLKDGCLVQVPFCGEKSWEEEIKKRSAADTGGEAIEAGAPSMGAKSLCRPFKPLKELNSDMKCIISGQKATQVTMFGRSY
jgi:bifunctional glutamyl/prolyl-tRNA synthetase